MKTILALTTLLFSLNAFAELKENYRCKVDQIADIISNKGKASASPNYVDLAETDTGITAMDTNTIKNSKNGKSVWVWIIYNRGQSESSAPVVRLRAEFSSKDSEIWRIQSFVGYDCFGNQVTNTVENTEQWMIMENSSPAAVARQYLYKSTNKTKI